jgi:hypothetical protein
MNPDRSVLALSAVLLKRLKTARIEGYSSLLEYAESQTRDGDTLFPGALSLLYLLGLVEYRPRSDAFEYVGP